MIHRSILRPVLFFLLTLGGLQPALAIPEFARRFDLECTACHSIPPKLNAAGHAFRASGYREPGLVSGHGNEPRGRLDTVPFATWITLRHESRGGGVDDTFLPKVELISGGPIGNRASYFVEWRVVSESLRGDGSFQDRGGRFEDLFLEWALTPSQTIKVGQFRSLNQVDVSLRLSPAEPLVFKNGIPTGTDSDPRLQSLMSFSPSSRSPSLSWSFRSRTGKRPSDGLFHFVTVPFAGEFSIPLSDEASDEASFELAGPKGVYAETFWRRGVRSVGGHAFVENDHWLATAVAVWEFLEAIEITGAVGVEHRDDLGENRVRSSLQGEYLWMRGARWRSAAGLRVEEVSDDGGSRTLVPYAVAAFPNRRYTVLVQAEYRDQDGTDVFVLDLSAIF